jgi:hypothetical protein
VVFDDLDDFDIDGYNSAGVHSSHYYNRNGTRRDNDYDDNYCYEPSPPVVPKPVAPAVQPQYVFMNKWELITSTEVQHAICMALAAKDRQIREYQDEILQLHEKINRAQTALE